MRMIARSHVDAPVAVEARVLVSGVLDSTPSTDFRVELFSSPTCDASGNGEGRTFRGVQSVTASVNVYTRSGNSRHS
jgi:hypothetical protein